MINYWKMISNRQRSFHSDIPSKEDRENTPNVPEETTLNESHTEEETSSPFRHILPNYDVAAEHLTEYMTCSICFQFVTDNRECLRCHRVSCSSCISQFHTSKDKSHRKPCPACNTPTIDEDGKELSLESSLLEMASHLHIRSINEIEGENELIDSFLSNLNSSMFSSCTKLVHNKLLQKMVDEMPSVCPNCGTPLLHGDLHDHFSICQSPVTYGEYYRLGKAFDQQHEELLEIEKENVMLRNDNLTHRSTRLNLEQQIVDLKTRLQDCQKELMEAHTTTKELLYVNQQLERTVQMLRDSR